MFIIIFINVLLAVFVSADDNLYHRQSIYNSDGLIAEQEQYSGINYNKFKIYHTSKHVFYWLYTKESPEGQLLNRSEPHMIESTSYNPENPTKVIVHGWLGTTQEKQGLCSYNVKSYFKVGNYNVICVDWKQYSTDLTYAVAKIRAKHIGYDIAKVLRKITYNMTKGVENIHLIGHSMGAHIVGFTGKNLTNQIPRITGLDPAKPLYENSDPKDRLNTTDAKFVDVIHTNGDKNGLLMSLGHIDFFPNGGKIQPNCGKSDKSTGSCSHVKSYHYFAHSIWAKEDYIAHKCSSWEDFEAKKCNNTDSTFMGEHANEKKIGDFFLKTREEDKYRRRRDN